MKVMTSSGYLAPIHKRPICPFLDGHCLIMLSMLWVLVMLLWIGAAVPAWSEDDASFDEFEEGFEGNDPFDNVDIRIEEPDAYSIEANPFRLGGYLELDAAYAFEKDEDKLTRLEPALFLETEYKPTDTVKFRASGRVFDNTAYDIEDKDKEIESRLDEEAADVEPRDLYLDWKLDSIFSFRLGRQIIAWGASDYARITDVINPRDLTRPGMIDLEDARLPVAAIRLSAVFNAWSVDAVTVHEHPGSKITGRGSDFDYYARLREPGIWINDKQTPDVGIDDTGLALKVTHSFNGGDISLVLANTFNDQPFLSYDGPSGGVLIFTPEYDRVSTYGIFSSLAKGSSLFKLETALRQDRRITRNDVLAQITSGLPASAVRTTSRKDQIAALAGFEYTGISDLRLSVELEMTHTLDYQPCLSVDENQYRSFVQATRNMFNETLELDFLWIHLYPGLNPGDGNIYRFTGGYDIRDDLNIQAGIIFYESAEEDSNLYPYKDQDRVFIRVKYSF